MALVFPTNPTNGEVYQDYIFNTATNAWNRISPAVDIQDQIDTIDAKFPVSLTSNVGGTLPIANGGTGATTVAGAQAALGIKVIQVLHSYVNTPVINNSSTWVDTGASVTITPTASTSKILVFAIQPAAVKNPGNANSALNLRLMRDATMLETHTNMGYDGISSDNRFGSADFAFMDSPATTSAITYKTQLANNFNGVGVSIARAMLVVMEIKA